MKLIKIAEYHVKHDILQFLINFIEDEAEYHVKYDHGKPALFCVISSPLMVKPPVFEALPGENKISCLWNKSIASGVVAMFAPSATHRTAFCFKALAS